MSVDPFFNDRATIDVFERSFYAGQEAAEEVQEILAWRPLPRRVLDIGCNAGLHAFEWARLGAEVVGIDSAPTAIQLARERAGTRPGLRFEVADLLEGRLDRWGTFDLVTALGGVFNCLPRPALVPAFRAVRAALAPNGDFVFDVLGWFPGGRKVFLRRDGRGALKIVWEFTLDPVEGRGRVVGQFLETGAIQNSERAFYTIPEVTVLLGIVGLERIGVGANLALSDGPAAADPSLFFRARPRSGLTPESSSQEV
jgi:SAM-dependent methyltransferase